MMKRVFNLFLLGMSLFFCFSLMAQQTSKTKAAVKPGNSKKIFLPPVYLGKSNLNGGVIKKRTFDSLLKQGISAHDSLGNKYRIVGFDFIYAERSLYEDSVGNDQILTDFQSQFCKGDTLDASITFSDEETKSIYERTKWGDTAYFDRIRLFPLPGNKIFPTIDTLPILGRNMKFIITR